MRQAMMSLTSTFRFVSSLNSRFSASLRVSFSSTWPPGTCHLALKGSTLRLRSRNLLFFVQMPSTHTTSFFWFKVLSFLGVGLVFGVYCFLCVCLYG